MKRTLAALALVAAVFAAVAGSWALLAVSSTPAEAKSCGICPLVCIGVTCDDGRTYCNSCLAACAGAHHCVVTGF